MAMVDRSVFTDRILKVTYEGDTRRVKLAIDSSASSDEVFASIRMSALSIFGMPQIPVEDVQLKYLDDEDDLCTLTSHTVDDFALLMPQGVLRLKMVIQSPGDDQTSTSAPFLAKEIDEPPSVEPSLEDADARGPDDTFANVDSLRETLKGLLQKVDPNARKFMLSMLQNMNPQALHALIGMALAMKTSHEGMKTNPGMNADYQRLEALLPILHDMDPTALHTLLMDVFRSFDSTSSNTEDGQSAEHDLPHANPLETMLGAFLGGKGCQASGCQPPQNNALLGLLGGLLSGKSIGKGGNPAGKGGQAPDRQPPQNNAMQDFFGGLLKGKGNGKGGNPADTVPTTQQNPLEQLVSLLADKGCGKGGYPPGHPLEIVAGLAGLGAGKGFGKGTGAPGVPGGMCGGNSTATISAGCLPSETSAQATTIQSQEHREASAPRAAFEESVDDLINMGLVSDRQMARELLTQHGDISSVVDVLSGGP